jgi:GDP-4-dehydro-6-deoxy-D-mannose reductase
VNNSVFLILGGNGFVGSYLKNILKKKKIIFYAPDKKKINLLHTKKIILLCKKRGVTHIVNLAGISQVDSETEENYIKINSFSVLKILSSLKKINFKGQFIHASSSYVYKKTKKKISETDLESPESYYALSKKITDDFIKYYSSYLNCISLRFFNIIGPGQNKNYFFPFLILSLLNKNNNKIFFKELDSVRDFVDVRDAARLIVYISNFKKKLPLLLNVCRGEGVKISTFVKIAIKNLKIKKKYFSLKSRKQTYCVGNSNLLKKTGFIFKYNLMSTILFAKNYYESKKI